MHAAAVLDRWPSGDPSRLRLQLHGKLGGWRLRGESNGGRRSGHCSRTNQRGQWLRVIALWRRLAPALRVRWARLTRTAICWSRERWTTDGRRNKSRVEPTNREQTHRPPRSPRRGCDCGNIQKRDACSGEKGVHRRFRCCRRYLYRGCCCCCFLLRRRCCCCCPFRASPIASSAASKRQSLLDLLVSNFSHSESHTLRPALILLWSGSSVRIRLLR